MLKHKDLVETFKIGRLTVSDILKRSDHYWHIYEDTISGKKKRMTNAKFHYCINSCINIRTYSKMINQVDKNRNCIKTV